MTRTWKSDGVFEGGSSFGGNQISDDVAHFYVAQNDDGTHVVVSHAFAVVSADESEEEEAKRYAVDEMTVITTCTDPENPGSTELNGEIEYGEGSYLSYETEAEALAEARRLANLDISGHLA